MLFTTTQLCSWEKQNEVNSDRAMDASQSLWLLPSPQSGEREFGQRSAFRDCPASSCRWRPGQRHSQVAALILPQRILRLPRALYFNLLSCCLTLSPCGHHRRRGPYLLCDTELSSWCGRVPLTAKGCPAPLHWKRYRWVGWLSVTDSALS